MGRGLSGDKADVHGSENRKQKYLLFDFTRVNPFHPLNPRPVSFSFKLNLLQNNLRDRVIGRMRQRKMNAVRAGRR